MLPTFGTFVVSDPSRAAFEAASMVAEHPRRAHNPLFLYGPTGAGKSHLLRAIEHDMRARGARVLRLSARELAEEMVAAIRADRYRAFCDSLCVVDALLVDDFHFDAGFAATQQELRRIIDDVAHARVQVVVASLEPLDGFAVGLGYPTLSARMEILRRAAAGVPEEMLLEIAERVFGDPRRLLSALAGLRARLLVAPLRGAPERRHGRRTPDHLS